MYEYMWLGVQKCLLAFELTYFHTRTRMGTMKGIYVSGNVAVDHSVAALVVHKSM